MKWIFLETEPHLYTVGFYDPSGRFNPESDHNNIKDAFHRLRFLNGGNPAISPDQSLRDALEKIKAFIIRNGNWKQPDDPNIQPVQKIIEAALSSHVDDGKKWTDEDVEMLIAVDLRFEKMSIGQQDLWIKFIGEWMPGQINSGLGQALDDKFKSLHHVDDGWVEIKEGCEMPKPDKFITVRNIYGHYRTYVSDKDDTSFLDERLKGIDTHWQYVKEPY